MDDITSKILGKIDFGKSIEKPQVLAGLKKSNLIKDVKRSKDGFVLTLDATRRFANNSPLKVVANFLRQQNPQEKIVLDEELVNMKPNADLLFVSKAPLWCLKQKGNLVILKRTYA